MKFHGIGHGTIMALLCLPVVHRKILKSGLDAYEPWSGPLAQIHEIQLEATCDVILRKERSIGEVRKVQHNRETQDP